MFLNFEMKTPSDTKKNPSKLSVSNICKHIRVYNINWTVANNTVLGSKEIKKT